MKAKLDKILNGKKVIAGLSSQLIGRIRGSNRSRKKVTIWGNLGQQDRLRRILTNSTAINTRYGTLGIKVVCALKRNRRNKAKRMVINKLKITLKNTTRLFSTKKLNYNRTRKNQSVYN